MTRFTWDGLVPEQVAFYQRAWEKRARIYHAHVSAGLSIKELAAMLGVSYQRVCEQIRRHGGDLWDNKPNPVEKWMGEPVLFEEWQVRRLRNKARAERISGVPFSGLGKSQF